MQKVAALGFAKPDGPPKLEIRLLGPFEVLRDGELVPDDDWGRRKTKTLLKILLTDPGHVFTNDQLIEALFEGRNPEKALTNIHGRVSQLRRALEPELQSGTKSAFVVRREGGYCFALNENTWLDTTAFEALAAAAQRSVEQERWKEGVAAFKKAIAIYRGELLEEERYADWVLAAREQYASKHLDCLMQLAECHARLGSYRQAIASCREALRMQPHCEPVYRQAMRYHCLAGEYSQALEIYARCVRVLDEYLGVEPDPQTLELYDRIKNRDPEVFAKPTTGYRIAVVPFHFLEDDLEMASTADALCNALITRISMLESVWVASWADVSTCLANGSDAETLSRDLKVRYVLEGSLESSDGGLRASYRLVDARKAQHICAGQLELKQHGRRSEPARLADLLLSELSEKAAPFAEIQHEVDARTQPIVLPEDSEVRARPWIQPPAAQSPRTRQLVSEGDIAALRLYVPAHALAKILADSRRHKDLKWLTFLFAEALLPDGLEEEADPEVLERLTREYLQSMVQAVAEFDGAVAQIRARGLLAIFGLPVTHEDDVERAVRAACQLRETCSELASGPDDLAGISGVRCGIDVGRVLVGEDDPEAHVSTLLVGSAIRTAASLEAAAALDEILVTERVRRVVEPLFRMSPMTAGGVLHGDSTPVFKIDAARAVDGKARGIEGLASPLLGRSTEMDALQELLNFDTGASGRIVTVAGEAGIGKTRLLSEVLATVPEEAARSVYVRGLSYKSNYPYSLCRALALGLLEATDCDGADVSAMLETASSRIFRDKDEREAIVPFLAALMGLEGDAMRMIGTLDPEAVHQQITQALARLLEESCRRVPHVLLLDDIHWMDAESAAVIKRLLEIADRSRLMLLIAYREELAEHQRQVIDAAAHEYRHRHTHLRLEPLGERQGRALIDHLLSRPQLSERVYDLVVRKSAGNPLFAEELIRLLIDEGVISLVEGCRWEALGVVGDLEIPPRLVGLLEARIAHLTQDARRALQSAAVLGRAFDKKVLQACLPERFPIDACVLELQRAELLSEICGPPLQRFAFRHDLVREATCNTLPRSRMMETHARVAAVLEHLGCDSLDDTLALGNHFFEAQRWDKAIVYLLSAADELWSIYKSSDTATVLHRVLCAARKDGAASPVQLYDIRSRRARVFALLGRPDEEAEEMAELEKLSAALDDDETDLEMGLLWADFWKRRGSPGKAMEHATSVLERARNLGNREVEAQALLARAESATGSSEFEHAREDLQRALSVLQSTGQARVEADVHKLLGTVATRLGDYETAELQLERSLTGFRQLGDRKGEASIYGNLGALCIYLERLEDAVEHTQSALRSFRAIGDRRSQAKCLGNLGLLHCALGDPEQAVNDHEDALSIYREAKDPDGEAESLGNLAVAYEAIGAGGYPELITVTLGPCPEFAKSTRLNIQCLEKYRASGNRRGEAIAHFNAGSTALCGGNLHDASNSLRTALELARAIGDVRIAARSLSALARLELVSRNLGAALEYSSKAVQLAETESIPIAEEVRFTHAAVLQEAGNPDEAALSLQLARDGVLCKSHTIEDEATRERFLASYKPILDTWEQHRQESPDPQ